MIVKRVVVKKISVFFGIAVLITVFYIRSSTNDPVKQSDLVVFSFNRPLQLYAFLESVYKYCKGIGEIHVIYRTDTDKFKQGYTILKEIFPHVQYHEQGINPRQDFKPLTLRAAFESSASYIMFAVDDIVVKDKIDISACIEAVEKYNAYGFYFRLGKNLTNCYSWGSATQPLPPLEQEEPDLFSWHFNQGCYDWIYPNTVDMTMYRKKDIESDLRVYSYYSPNTLEVIWNRRSHNVLAKKGLCYTYSKNVNMPLNRVQNDEKNRSMKEWSPEKLLQEFLAGKKMDIAPLHCVHNTAAHMEYSPTFITR